MSHEDQTPSNQITLVLELSNPSASPDAHAAAVFSCLNNRVELIGSLPMPTGVRSSDVIMVLVETLCAQHEIKPTDLSRIVVSVGPGGYTALRIATTTAKVLAHALGCELVAVPTVCIAAQAIEPRYCPALIALASKNNHAHCAVVRGDVQVESIGVVGFEAVVDLGVRTIFADAHLPVSFVDGANLAGIEIRPIVLDARNGIMAAKGLGPIAPEQLSPVYAREPDAVTQWRLRAR